MESAGDPLKVLFICTGNICRSTMGQYMMQAAATKQGLEVACRSAGLAAPDQPPPPHTLAMLAAREIDASAHRSRTLTPAMVSSADLVLAMTGRHAREAVLLDMESAPKIFTLREFVRRSVHAGKRDPHQSIHEYIEIVSGNRPIAQLGAGGSNDDVADPYGRRKRAYRKAADLIESEITAALAALYPSGNNATTDDDVTRGE